MRTTIGFLAAGAGSIALLALSERASRRWLLRAETGRKLAHISSGVLAAVLPAFLPFPAIVGLAATFVPFMIISRRLKLFPILQQAERSTLGEIYFPVGVALAAVLVPHAAAYAFGVLAMGLGDAFAALVGERFGRRTYRLTSKKSFIGSGVMFLTAALVGLAVLIAAGRIALGSSFGVIGISLLLSVEEAALGGGLDNVALPMTGALLFRLVAG